MLPLLSDRCPGECTVLSLSKQGAAVAAASHPGRAVHPQAALVAGQTRAACVRTVHIRSDAEELPARCGLCAVSLFGTEAQGVWTVLCCQTRSCSSDSECVETVGVLRTAGPLGAAVDLEKVGVSCTERPETRAPITRNPTHYRLRCRTGKTIRRPKGLALFTSYVLQTIYYDLNGVVVSTLLMLVNGLK